ncbi:hypothetical protein [Endozoicomonas lisbonensis]|uniref:Uncharacterized protein n=1 Tax=Endozoicomonas lisbonensis TaxID=3120522 RepID=A0ABV2SRS3_9GAMM
MDVGAFNSLVPEDDWSPYAGYGQPKKQDEEVSQHVMDAAVDDMGEKELRATGMAVALTWIEDGDYSAEYLNDLIAGLASEDDEDGEGNELEEDFYDGLRSTTADALAQLGGSESQVAAAIDGSDDAAESLGEHLSGKMAESESSDEELIGNFAVSASLITDSARRKVVRNGKVQIKKRPLRKKRRTSAQRAALKKARRKAHNSSARRSRKKSMRVRKQRGM